MLCTILHQPRKLWLRKALFQIHLWLGILLALYAIVISLSGSILVFQDEIRRVSLPHASFDTAHIAPIEKVIARVQKSEPASRLTYIAVPQKTNPWWALYLTRTDGSTRTVYADAATGIPIGQNRWLFIDFVLDVHVYLLLGRTGFIANCIAGIGLLILAMSGSVLWWPGLKLWKRAFLVSLRGGWKRMNYDLHSAVGIWTLLIVSWWGITAIYFLFPAKVNMAVNAISPLVGMKPPIISEPAPGESVVPLGDILARRKKVSPGYLGGITLPEKSGGKVIVYVDRREPGDFSHRDIDTFDGHTGKLLSVWHYGENKSLGDWFLWLMYPLHFGTLWGMGVKVIWAILGLSIAALSVTGVLMYWNRKLRFLIRSHTST